MDCSLTADLKFDNQGRLVVPKGTQVVSDSGLTYEPMVRQVQNTIESPPVATSALIKTACNNDEVTIDTWMPQWSSQLKANAAKYDFNALTAMSEWGKEALKPVICAGSGPSLKRNYKVLKEYRGDVRIVSCLHNFGFFEDNEIMGSDDYYLSLDAGEITISEVFDGSEVDWSRTKDRTLIAYVSSHPELLEKWQGRILFFCSASVNADIHAVFKECVDFTKIPSFNTGGNALGACMYFARAVLGCSQVIFVGADFSFDYTQSFHPFENSYEFSGVMPAIDIMGNRVFTWASYYGFKCWFDFMACGGSGNRMTPMINCTEGGILGAYPEGNIKQIPNLPLGMMLESLNMHKEMPDNVKFADTKLELLF